MVPEEGVEPTRPCDQRILSPPRLPFRHSGALIILGYLASRGNLVVSWCLMALRNCRVLAATADSVLLLWLHGANFITC